MQFLTFYEMQVFITVAKTACHMSVSLVRLTQSTSFHHTYLRSILILSPIYAKVLQVVCSHQIFLPKPCTHFFFPRYMLHAPPISYVLPGLSPAAPLYLHFPNSPGCKAES